MTTYAERAKSWRKAADAMDHLLEQGIDIEQMTPYLPVYGEPKLTLTQVCRPDDHKAVLVERACKALFGPLIAIGAPPDVKLEGVIEFDGLPVIYHLVGAFKCEVTSRKEVELSDEELAQRTASLEYAVKQARVTTKIVATYSCEPVRARRPVPGDD